MGTSRGRNMGKILYVVKRTRDEFIEGYGVRETRGDMGEVR